MTFTYPFGAYNVQATINQWFVTNVTGAGSPAWMPSARVIFNWGKEQPLISGYSGAAFSMTHLPVRDIANYEGKYVDNGSAGVTKGGQVEINCWVDKRLAGNGYMMRLGIMSDMVSRLFTTFNTIPLMDIAAATANPASATGRIVLTDVEYQPPAADSVNPDIWRIRQVAGYWWTERA